MSTATTSPPSPISHPASKSPPPLETKEKLGYSLGDLASNFAFQSISLYLMFFYTDVFGISVAAVGTMFFVSRIWDTFNDPLMGVLADRTETRWGKFRPYLLWMSVPFGVMLVLTFTTPDLSPQGKLLWAYTTYTLMMMVYTAINIPYSALMGVISPNPQERTIVSSYRFFGAAVGALIIQGTLLPMVDFFGKGNQALGFSISMAVLGSVSALLWLGTFKATHERVQPKQSENRSLKKDLIDLAANKPWLILFVVGLFNTCSFALRGSIILYYFKYFIKDEMSATYFMILGSIFWLLGIVSTPLLVKKVGDKKRLFMALAFLYGLCQIGFYFAAAEQLIIIYALQALASFLNGPTSPLLWSMYTDTADYSEWRNGRRATGLVVSAGTFAQKFGWTIGGAFAGWILAFYGFEANVDQAPETIHAILLLIGLIPGLFSILGALSLLLYPLDDNLLSKIENDLQAAKI